MQGTKFVVYTDGGCQVNPGGAGGLGVVILNSETGQRQEISEGYVSSTNNRMEILAVVRGLSQLPRGAEVDLYSDSEYVLKTAMGEYREKKNRDLWQQLHAVMDDKQMRFHWVRGHQGNALNERCDQLATQGQHMREKQVDAGYVPETETKPVHESRAGAENTESPEKSWQVNVPEAYAAFPEQMDPALYAERYQVNLKCAEQIQAFAAAQRRVFKAYAALRTDGLDAWSRRPQNVLEERVDPEVWKLGKSLLNRPTDFLTAMRWHCRGLSLLDAVQKVLVDAELASRNVFQRDRKKGK